MNTQERINNVTSLDQSQNQNVTWGVIETSELPPPIRQPRGRGEIPYQMEIYNHRRKNFQRQPSNSVNKMANSHSLNKTSNSHQFAEIIPSVREACGGYNTLSNDVIEKRYKERQAKYMEENKLNNSDLSKATSSSGSSQSYKTTLQDSYEIKKAYGEQVTSSEEVTSEKQNKIDAQRYKKNALMLGLLRSVDDTDIERESTTASSEEYYETNSCDDVASAMANLNVTNESVMQNDRIGRFFQSQEDEDVYYHPLKEQIQKDPEWQKLRLKRKGTETVLSSRQFFLNIDDDEFTFESRRSN